ncbi:MBL fold metallo-hydrolase [Flagellimonas sp.]|uniref:MBL fold metallo-hydrolase n=1 Tax=Flagellimonas sp. TaxID=2058762 RepID=UPI003BAF0AA7
MKVSFLGTGNSISNHNRKNTSLILQSTNSILIDCSGNPIQAAMQSGINPDSISDVILTHNHVDHIYAIPSLVHQMYLLHLSSKRAPFRFIGNKSTLDIVHKLLKAFNLLQRKGIFEIEFIEVPKQGISIQREEYRIKLFPVNHVWTDCFGCKFLSEDGKSIVYSSDTEPTNNLVKESQGIDLLVHECSTFTQNKLKGHTSFSEILELTSQISSKRIRLVHLPKIENDLQYIIDNKLNDLFGNLVQLAYDGEVLEI